MSTPESHDAGQAAAAYSLKCTKLEARLAEVARELDEGARFARVRQLESALQECEVERHHAQSALAARDALVVTLREALKSTRDNLWDWVFSRVEGSKRIKVDAASSQCHKADQALALTPSSPAHCAVVSKEELAELRQQKQLQSNLLLLEQAQIFLEQKQFLLKS